MLLILAFSNWLFLTKGIYQLGSLFKEQLIGKVEVKGPIGSIVLKGNQSLTKNTNLHFFLLQKMHK